MNQKNRAYIAFAALAVVSVYSPAAFAQAAQGLGGLATSWTTGTLSPLANFLSQLAFFCGIVFVLLGILKFRAHSANPNDQNAKLSTAVTYIVVAAALIGIPTVMGMGVYTLFGASAKTTSMTSTLQSLTN